MRNIELAPANKLLLNDFVMNKKVYGVSDIGNILMIKVEESILQELLDLLDKKEQCQIMDLPQTVHMPDILSFPDLKIYGVSLKMGW